MLSEKKHSWDNCVVGGAHVLCGYCGNTCCTGSSGDKCPDKCASAYAYQAAGWGRHDAHILAVVRERVEACMRLTVSNHVSGMSEAQDGAYLARVRVLAILDNLMEGK